MDFDFEEPFYPRLVLGQGAYDLEKNGYIPPRNWQRIVCKEFINTVPCEIREHLEHAAWTAYVALWPKDVPDNTMPALSPQEIERIQASDDKRYLAEQIGGRCNYSSKFIYASLRYQGDQASWSSPTDHIRHIVRVLRHETAHAVMSLAPPAFIEGRMQEALRQDIVGLGGYAHMRSATHSYYTPSQRQPERDIYEIWAEALAAAWGGGVKKGAHELFPQTHAAGQEFANFLIYNAPSKKLNTADFLEAQNEWLERSEINKLQEAYKENRTIFFRSTAKETRKSKNRIRRLSPEALTLTRMLHNAREEVCDHGLPYRTRFLSPVNVVLTLSAELVRKADSETDIDKLALLWTDYMERIPSPIHFGPGKKIGETIMRFGAKELALQLVRLSRNDAARLVLTLRRISSAQHKGTLLHDMIMRGLLLAKGNRQPTLSFKSGHTPRAIAAAPT